MVGIVELYIACMMLGLKSVSRSIWQFTDWAGQARMLYGPKRRRAQFTVLARTDQSVYSYCPKIHVLFVLYNTEAMCLKQLLFNYINTLFY